MLYNASIVSQRNKACDMTDNDCIPLESLGRTPMLTADPHLGRFLAKISFRVERLTEIGWPRK